MSLEKAIARWAARRHCQPVRLLANECNGHVAVEVEARENVDGRAEQVDAIVAKGDDMAFHSRHTSRVEFAADKLHDVLKAQTRGDQLLLHEGQFRDDKVAKGVARIELAKVVAVANVEVGQPATAQDVCIAVRAERSDARLVAGVDGLGVGAMYEM